MQEAVSNAKRAFLVSLVCVILATSNVATAEASAVEGAFTAQAARPCWLFCW